MKATRMTKGGSIVLVLTDPEAVDLYGRCASQVGIGEAVFHALDACFYPSDEACETYAEYVGAGGHDFRKWSAPST